VIDTDREKMNAISGTKEALIECTKSQLDIMREPKGAIETAAVLKTGQLCLITVHRHTNEAVERNIVRMAARRDFIPISGSTEEIIDPASIDSHSASQGLDERY